VGERGLLHTIASVRKSISLARSKERMERGTPVPPLNQRPDIPRLGLLSGKEKPFFSEGPFFFPFPPPQREPFNPLGSARRIHFQIIPRFGEVSSRSPLFCSLSSSNLVMRSSLQLKKAYFSKVAFSLWFFPTFSQMSSSESFFLTRSEWLSPRGLTLTFSSFEWRRNFFPFFFRERFSRENSELFLQLPPFAREIETLFFNGHLEFQRLYLPFLFFRFSFIWILLLQVPTIPLVSPPNFIVESLEDKLSIQILPLSRREL